ncbi:hypothetical protein TrVE_jg12852 [Triparma verrucosa]|uniref:SAC3/GANP/THP3 conserved domain-containing protein n=1 Tax=Triparma verrucosa TaxID=1606542 RepID=A0A9W7CGJ2_9STRA|nr:hypothetical protein TrVE_jg12852 [Triparma verrucosa]
MFGGGAGFGGQQNNGSDRPTATPFGNPAASQPTFGASSMGSTTFGSVASNGNSTTNPIPFGGGSGGGNPFAQSSSAASSSTGFGAAPSQTTSAGFGAFGSAASTSLAPAPTLAPAPAPAFGSSTPAFGSSAPAFGSSAPAFGSPGFGSSTNASSSSNPPFGSPGFGSSTNATSSSSTPFGSSTPAPTPAPAPFGASPFGSPTQPQPKNQNQTNSSPFSSQSSSKPPLFGSSSKPSSSSILNPGASTFQPSAPSTSFNPKGEDRDEVQRRIKEKKALLQKKLNAEKEKQIEKSQSQSNSRSNSPFGKTPKKKKGGLMLSDEEREAMKAAAASAPTFGGAPAFAGGPKKKKGGIIGMSDDDREAMKAAAASAPTFGGGGSSAAPAPAPSNGMSLAARNALRFNSTAPKKSFLAPSELPPPPAILDDDDDDDMPHDLTAATSLVGTCMTMCPTEEIVQRDKESDIKLLERPSTTVFPKGWTLKDSCIKRFRRSAAAYKLDIPSLVRPPPVLERTLSFIEEYVMERDRQGVDDRTAAPHTVPDPMDVYQFVWDRTRMIRKDFILQNYTGSSGGKNDASAVRCHERIARWHICVEHQLSHIEDYVVKQSSQNITELGQTLKSLNQFYDDPEERHLLDVESPTAQHRHGVQMDHPAGINPTDFEGDVLTPQDDETVSTRIIGNKSSPNAGTNEAGMRSLYILLNLDNDGGMEVTKYVACLKRHIFDSPEVQFALRVFIARRDNNYVRFFNLLRSAGYLQSCLMFKYVETTRKQALKIMWKSYGNKTKSPSGEWGSANDLFPLARLADLLCFESEEEAENCCRHYSLTVEVVGGVKCIIWKKTEFNQPLHPKTGSFLPCRPAKMVKTIEAKLNGATRLHICRGGQFEPVDPEKVRLAQEAKARKAALEATRLEQARRMREAREEALAEEKERARQEEIRSREEREALAFKEKERAAELRVAEAMRLQKAKAEKEERIEQEKERMEREKKELAQRKQKEAEDKRKQEEMRRQQMVERHRAEQARIREEAERERLRLEEERRQQLKEEEMRRLAAEERERERSRLLELEEERAADAARVKLGFIRWLRLANRMRRERRVQESYDAFDPVYRSPFSDSGSGNSSAVVQVLEHADADEAMNAVYANVLRKNCNGEGEKFSYDSMWSSSEAAEVRSPVLFKLGVVGGNASCKVGAAVLEFIFSRLGSSWEGRDDSTNERIQVKVVEVNNGKSARNCSAVLFVASSGVGEEINWPKGAIDGVAGVPRILFLVGPAKNIANVDAAVEAVGEDNVDNQACVVNVAVPTAIDVIEESLYDSVKSLIAYRAGCGDDPKLVRVTKDEVVRRVIRQVIWWKGAEVEGRDVLRAVTRAVRMAGNLLNNEMKKDREKKKNWPAEEFCINGSVKDYFGRGQAGGVLPRKWADRNKKVLSSWAKMPLLLNSGRESDEKRILIEMLMSVMKGDEGEKGVVLLNIQDLFNRNLWRRALEELCGFWERIVTPRSHDPGYLYLDHEALGRVMKGLLSVVNQTQGPKKRKGKKKPKQGLSSENDWEQREWAEEREREDMEAAEWLDGLEEDDGMSVYALVDGEDVETEEEEEEEEELFSPPPTPLSDRGSNKRRLAASNDGRTSGSADIQVTDFKKSRKTILSGNISTELSDSTAFSDRLRAMINSDVGL